MTIFRDTMKKKLTYIFFTILFIPLVCDPGLCLDGKDIVKLKEGGISDAVIQLVMQEKIIETCAFTVDEILSMKRAGMGNETILKIIENASFMKDAKTIEYGKDIRPVRFSSVEDIIELKRAGISDEVIEAIVSGSDEINSEDYDRAWRMLENMGLIVDER